MQYINYPWLRHGQSQKLCFLIKCLFELLKSTQNTQYEHLNEVVLFKQNIQKATVLRKKYANAKLTYY
jgi:hypothetical protein